MMPKSNKVARQLSSMPNTHRQSTLSAISAKAHAITSEIKHLGVEVDRLKNLMERAPKGDGLSRLDWIHRQIQQGN
ncbi:hypothetical protein IT407_00745 [Candidatus Uhrbacteria bacterium]|nr:hypothetical protein [Candidatus Uhrbacteria bacterium]